MTVDSLMQTCEELGIKLALKADDNSRLQVDAPKGATRLRVVAEVSGQFSQEESAPLLTGMEEPPPRLVPRKESAHHRRFDRAPVERFDVVGPRVVCGRDVVLGLGCMPAAIAAGAEAHPGIERIREGGHAGPRECWYSGAFRIKRAKREGDLSGAATSPYPTRSSPPISGIREMQKQTDRASRWCARAPSWRMPGNFGSVAVVLL